MWPRRACCTRLPARLPGLLRPPRLCPQQANPLDRKSLEALDVIVCLVCPWIPPFWVAERLNGRQRKKFTTSNSLGKGYWPVVEFSRNPCEGIKFR